MAAAVNYGRITAPAAPVSRRWPLLLAGIVIGLIGAFAARPLWYAVDPLAAPVVHIVTATATPMPSASPLPAFLPVVLPRCEIASVDAAALLVRTGPGVDYAPLTALSAGMRIPAIGRTSTGWLVGAVDERQGWVAQTSAGLTGDCTALPVLLDPTLTIAPADAAAEVLEIDRDGGGVYEQVISIPGDRIDIVWVSMINLYSQPPNNLREVVITLECAGVGLERVRWGTAYAPEHTCGAIMRIPFLFGLSQQPLAILLPETGPQSAVHFRLVVRQADASAPSIAPLLPTPDAADAAVG